MGPGSSGSGRIAYQGEPGSNSHLVCRENYPEWATLPCATFEDAFAALKGGGADRAMIPIDNTVAGRVADIHHLLPESNSHIIAEHFLRISFHLMAPPGATLDTVRRVRSHIHALGQCRRMIRSHGLTPVIAGDTAGAAREVAELGDVTQAAIAPLLAAEIYGLDVLASSVEDEAHNTTRFIVLSREPIVAEHGRDPVVTTLLFQVRNLPAALYKALGCFATNNVNMTKLESYMVAGQFTATQFLAEVDGHPDDDGLGQALRELEFYSTSLKILGVYPAAAYRATSVAR